MAFCVNVTRMGSVSLLFACGPVSPSATGSAPALLPFRAGSFSVVRAGCALWVVEQHVRPLLTRCQRHPSQTLARVGGWSVTAGGVPALRCGRDGCCEVASTDPSPPALWLRKALGGGGKGGCRGPRRPGPPAQVASTQQERGQGRGVKWPPPRQNLSLTCGMEHTVPWAGATRLVLSK